MMARLNVTGILAALAFAAALAGTALAEDEGWPDGFDVGAPDETGAPGNDGDADDPGAIGDGDLPDDSQIYETTVIDDEGGEPVAYVEDGGDPVGYGPDDCIDCNVAPTVAFDGEGRGHAENQRSGVDRASRAMDRDSGGSGRPTCGSLRPHDMRPCDK